MTRKDLQERFEERAGICEFDGQMTRDEAEALAQAEMESHWNAIKKMMESVA